LGDFTRAELALKLEPMLKEQAKENLSKGGKGLQISAKVDTRKELSNSAKVSHDTIDKVKKIIEKAYNLRLIIYYLFLEKSFYLRTSLFPYGHTFNQIMREIGRRREI
jgi:hypothetical protein